MSAGGEAKPVIIVRHGLFSNEQEMSPIEAALRRTFGTSIDVNNKSYDSRRGVLENAAGLVRLIADHYQSRRIVLIGHSLGG